MEKNDNHKKRKPIHARIADNAKKKMERGAKNEDVVQYICRATLQHRHAEDKILAAVNETNPLIAASAKILINKTIEKRKDRIKQVQQAREQVREQAEQEELARVAELQEQYAIACEQNNAIRWGIILNEEDRRRFFSAQERKQIIELRREKLSTYKTRTLLDCTLTEINRWDEQGLLPHAFTQRIQVGGKTTEARFWLKSEVLKLAGQIPEWRKAHELKKSFKRKKNPLQLAR